jgi:plasmid maintenance system antidote protein VapI
LYRKAILIALQEKKENGAHSAKKSAVLPKHPHKEVILSITPTTAPGKPNVPNHLIPQRREGLKILYKVKDLGSSFTQLAQALSIHPSNISNVVSGRRSSARIEAEIARILGKADWNEVVLEARSEVQKKPVKVILQEMRREAEEWKKALQEEFGTHMAMELDFIDSRGRPL